MMLAGTFGRAMGSRRSGAAILLALLATACGSSKPITASDLPTTETFSGTVAAKGAAVHQFTVAHSGLATLSLIALSTNVVMGIGIGYPSTTATAGCSLVGVDAEAIPGTALTGAIEPGTYCAAIYDVGDVKDSVSYVLTLTHP
jgi:hypothetical protein